MKLIPFNPVHTGFANEQDLLITFVYNTNRQLFGLILFLELFIDFQLNSCDTELKYESINKKLGSKKHGLPLEHVLLFNNKRIII